MKSSTFRLLLVLFAFVLLLGIFSSIGILEGGSSDNCKHDFEDKVIQKGSCTTDEIINHVCKHCNSSYQTISEAVGAHKFGNEFTTYGDSYDSYHEVIKTKKCSLCDYVERTIIQCKEVLILSGPDPVDMEKDPCYMKIVMLCDECGAEYVSYRDVHNSVTDGVCDVCGDTNVVEAG